MTKTELLKKLQASVTEKEYVALQNKQMNGISEHNRTTILHMMQQTEVSEDQVEETDVEDLDTILKTYLARYLPDGRDSWKWIILSCIYLGFIVRKPLHAQSMVQYTVRKKGNTTEYVCPAKSQGKDTACFYCICRKMS